MRLGYGLAVIGLGSVVVGFAACGRDAEIAITPSPDQPIGLTSDPPLCTPSPSPTPADACYYEIFKVEVANATIISSKDQALLDDCSYDDGDIELDGSYEISVSVESPTKYTGEVKYEFYEQVLPNLHHMHDAIATHYARTCDGEIVHAGWEGSVTGCTMEDYLETHTPPPSPSPIPCPTPTPTPTATPSPTPTPTPAPSPTPTPNPSPSPSPSPTPTPTPSPILCESPSLLRSRLSQGTLKESQLLSLLENDDDECHSVPEDQEIRVNANPITINFDDWFETDEDIIHVSLDRTGYNQVLTLPFSPVTLEIPLEEGENLLTIRAVNTGLEGPNTMGMYIRPRDQVVSGMTEVQVMMRQDEELKFTLILEDEDEDYEERVPAETLIVRDYELFMNVMDNGQLIDEDEISFLLEADEGPNKGSLQSEDLQLTDRSQRTGIKELRSHVNTVLITSESEGNVKPTTLEFVVEGVEKSQSAGNQETIDFDGSKALKLGESMLFEIECRRQKPSSGTNPGQLGLNLQESKNPGVTSLYPALPNYVNPYYGERLPCKTESHHIVSWNARAAAFSRQILSTFGIGINDAVNGVVLPANAGIPVQGRPHRGGGVHRNQTNSNITDRLINSVRSVDPLLIPNPNMPSIDMDRYNELKEDDPAKISAVKQEVLSQLATIRTIYLNGNLP